MKVTEFAEFQIVAGKEAEFEAAASKAVAIFAAAEGCVSMRVDRVVEQPSAYRLIVGWETIAHHNEGFRNSPGFQEWRGLVAHFFAAPPKVDHGSTVVDGFAKG
ncbi:antibiotic biosynthesis monooxygenase family protein [Sinorhizobium meliloti]|uniref:putative quinol monooxygenase n=1 Tax=Rhizobium meliloti TaxID=382 RepID=UPI00299D291C|nr:antibiotic biosynthesis monooxygenase [Sinorhizobium meliloti]